MLPAALVGCPFDVEHDPAILRVAVRRAASLYRRGVDPIRPGGDAFGRRGRGREQDNGERGQEAHGRHGSPG